LSDRRSLIAGLALVVGGIVLALTAGWILGLVVAVLGAGVLVIALRG
jgi:hypothetical protein